MANQSIYSAFERMWEHTSVADSEIRGLISELTERFNALAESDDTTLDTLKEIVEYIKSNRTLIESVTTTKVNVDDIIDNLITNDSKKPLSAAQGKALKDLIDALQTAINNITIPVTSVNNKTGAVNLTASDVGALPSTTTIPTKVSDLTNDSEFATEQYVDDAIEDHDTSPLAHANKMNSQNPVGEGSFSMNRVPDTVIGINSFAEGMMTEASGDYSHAEGHGTTAEGECSHAEGDSTEASGDYSHAEGRNTYAEGAYSHVEGRDNHIHNDYAHVEGCGNSSSGNYSHVQGKYSIGSSNAAHVVGNGSEDQSSNAHVLDWNGNAWFAGDVYVGSESGIDNDGGSKKLATEEYVDNATANIDLSMKVSRSGDTMTGPIEFSGTSHAIDFDTSGWIRGKTTSGSRYDIFGYSNPTTLQVGGTYPALALKGKNTRPTYNDAEMALLSDVESNMFIAEYDVTTLEELQAAVNAGKQLVCKYSESNGIIKYATGYPVNTNSYIFSEICGKYVITFTYAVSRWGSIQTKYLPVTNENGKLEDVLVAKNNTDYTTKQVRNIILVADGEEIPAGANGDICLVYAP